MSATGLRFRHPVVWLSTWFGVGYAPLAPGTFGSLAALPFAWFFLWAGGRYGGGVLFVASALAFWAGLWATSRYATLSDRKDPKEVVIDEVAGQWFTLLFARPEVLWHFAAGLVLFRIFDIAKPWPVSWADRHVPGSWGIMLDDFLAGFYAAILMYVVIQVSELPFVLKLVDNAF